MHDLYKEKCDKEKNLTLNLLATAILSRHVLISTFISQKLIDVKSMKELKQKRMKIYQLLTKKIIFKIYTYQRNLPCEKRRININY